MGAEFMARERALPVIVRPEVVPEQELPRKGPASDQERTHVMLEAVPLDEEEDDDERTTDAPESNPSHPEGAEDEPAARRGAASDEGRTYVMLNPVPVDDAAAAGEMADPEPAEPAPARPRSAGPPQAVARAVASDEARTQLMFGRLLPDKINKPGASARPNRRRQSNGAPPATEASGQKRAAADGEAFEEPRTHLLLHSLDLKDERETLLGRSLAKLSRLLPHSVRLNFWLEDLLRGAWGGALLIVALVFGIAAPLLDSLRADQLAPLSLTASILLLLGLSVLGFARLSTLQDQAGAWAPAGLPTRLRSGFRLLGEDLRQFDRSPRHLRLSTAGQLLTRLGLAGLALASCIDVLSRIEDPPEPAAVLRVLCGLVLLIGILLGHLALRRSPLAAPGPEDLAESLAAAAKLPPIIDLSEPLPVSFIGGYTLLHRSLVVLSQWRGSPWPDQAGSRAALERHFQRELPASRVEGNKWLGRSRRDGVADLVIDDLVLIEVQQGFGKTSADRALARLQTRARSWPGRPIILAIFEAPREALFESAATPGLLELHQQCSLVTARMPVRRW
jgi:hypothetical protein